MNILLNILRCKIKKLFQASTRKILSETFNYSVLKSFRDKLQECVMKNKKFRLKS